MDTKPSPDVAVWALTPGGARLAGRIAAGMECALYISRSVADPPPGASRFHRLQETLPHRFNRHKGHVFIMAAGIVVRMIAPLIHHKTTDPAVVVCDEAGRHAISLLSGHIGGANALAGRVAEAMGGAAVITTATDVTGAGAIDMMAMEAGMAIENPSAVKDVNMAMITGDPVWAHDPRGFLADRFPAAAPDEPPPGDRPGIYVDDLRVDLPPRILILRPPSLVAGMGCNRDTGAGELKSLLFEVFSRFRLARPSLSRIATIDAKRDEAGLTELARSLGVGITYFDRDALNRARGNFSPSAAAKHMGVKSVCEAAAILASGNGELIVPKQVSTNATVALARRHYTSSASAPAT